MTNRHEFDGRPYREVPVFDLFAGYEWIPAAIWAAILIGLFLIDGFLNHLDSLAMACFMVDQRREANHSIGNPPGAVVSLIVSLVIITAPIWWRLVP